MRRRSLHEGWTVRALSGPIPDGWRDVEVPAVVPGVVHEDLLRAGLIPDPLAGENEGALVWVGRSSWRFATEFSWTPDSETRHDLVFDGLDTVARITLNEVVIGRTVNQHRTYRFDVRHVLRSGSNRLVIDFESVFDEIASVEARLGGRPKIYPHSFAMVRKSACNFGWDWGPEVVTCGVWRSVRLESWSGVRIRAARPRADQDGLVRVAVELEHDGRRTPAPVVCRIGRDEARAEIEDQGVLSFRVSDPALWWPAGMGEPALHDLEISAGEDSLSLRIGFRTVEIDNRGDAHGIPFQFTINGRAVRVRGFNWIPDDVFPSRMTVDRYRSRLEDARDAGANLVRVWGGGVYESDEFYRLCDEMGLLVWQDFLFSCAAYPEEEPLWSEVRAEAVDAVNRLCVHPSLVVWNGSNENVWGMSEWGWDELIGQASWGQRYYDELLPGIVAALDPDRPYIPSSPFSWRADDQNEPSDGLSHRWDVWNEVDYAHYDAVVPRFVSEFGVQGAAAWSTLHAALDERPLDPERGQLALHQKAIDGHRKLPASFAEHFPPPLGLDDWHWTTQVNQAQAVRFGIERFRSHAPVCSGVILWQLNDCWPAVSWSVVDSAGIRKPAWHAVRSAFADRLLVLRDDELVAVNDSSESWHERVAVTRFSPEGVPGEWLDVLVDLPPGGVRRVLLPVGLRVQQRERGVVMARSKDALVYRLDRQPLHGGLPRARLEASVLPSDHGYDVEVVARSLVLDLCLLVDRVSASARVDSGMVTLRPGDRHVFAVTTPLLPDPGQLLDPMVLRCANDLVAGRSSVASARSAAR